VTTTASESYREEAGALRAGAMLMTLAAAAFIGYGILYAILNFTSESIELGIGSDQVDVTKDQIEQFSPSLDHYLSHANLAIAGFIISTGLATAALAWYGVRRRLEWAWLAAVATPVVGLAIALPSHYPYGFDTFWHLGPIYLAVAIFVVGAVLSGKALMERKM
jgi:cytochrome bd-type quinol oxidase subunit 2